LNTGEGLYEKVLAAGGGELVAPRPARASASIVLFRRGEAGDVEIFWLQRGEILPFMGGWHAFPGGGLERGDAGLPVSGAPQAMSPGGWTAACADPGSSPKDPDLVPGLIACALRELFEETGVLVACRATDSATYLAARRSSQPETPASSTPEESVGQTEAPAASESSDVTEETSVPKTVAEVRQTQLAGEKSLGVWLDRSGLALDASRLTFAGRWLTPPFSPARFDNRFFLVEWQPHDGTPRVVPPESEAGEWLTPRAALERLGSGHALAAPPIVHLLKVLDEEGPDAATPRLLDTAEANLGPLRRIELRPGIVLFPLAAATLPPAAHTNAYLLGTRECVLVDPGSPFEAENECLLAALDAAASQLGRKVQAIWLTHPHPDHVAGVEIVRRALEVPVFAHPRSADRLRAQGIALDGWLNDGQRVELDGAPPFVLKVHYTPGHSSGHLCFEVEATGDLIAGDMVAGFGTIVIDPPDGDMDLYLDSLDRLRELAPRTLFVGHGAPFLDSVTKLTEYRDHRLAREAQVLRCWEEGLREPKAMLTRVYPELAPAVEPLAERQILAHLVRLERLGRIAI
jgi:ribonuclease/clavin/mitogillin